MVFCELSKTFRNIFWYVARIFYKFTKILAKKALLSADGCFVKTNTTNCDDNDDATCFLILGRLLLLGNSWNEILLEVLERFICVAARSFYVD